MQHISTELVLIIICLVVIISYLFSIFSTFVKVPSVLLLLLFGIALRQAADYQHWNLTFPEQFTEFFWYGWVGNDCTGSRPRPATGKKESKTRA